MFAQQLAVMQPYFFPYIGYFQIINAADKFIFYDDVNFIKNGWINRNRIIINGEPKYFTIQLNGASSNKLINEVLFSDNRHKIKKTIQMAYKKSPMYEQVWPIIDDTLEFSTQSICELSMFSIRRVCEYLDISTELEVSSNFYSDTKGLPKNIRLQEICKRNKSSVYINSIGGERLYQKEDFKKENIALFFLKTKFIEYNQFTTQFIPALSIVDVMMHNSVEKIKYMLNSYELV